MYKLMHALFIGQLGMSLSSVKSLLFSFSILCSISELMAIAPNLLILNSEPSSLFHLDLKYRTVLCFHSSVLKYTKLTCCIRATNIPSHCCQWKFYFDAIVLIINIPCCICIENVFQVVIHFSHTVFSLAYLKIDLFRF